MKIIMELVANVRVNTTAFIPLAIGSVCVKSVDKMKFLGAHALLRSSPAQDI